MCGAGERPAPPTLAAVRRDQRLARREGVAARRTDERVARRAGLLCPAGHARELIVGQLAQRLGAELQLLEVHLRPSPVVLTCPRTPDARERKHAPAPCSAGITARQTLTRGCLPSAAASAMVPAACVRPWRSSAPASPGWPWACG